MDRIPIISVTGTKGKTTTVNLVADILRRAGRGVLHVDTSGHFVAGRRQSTIQDSRRIWGVKTPSITPGRYLTEFLHQSELQQDPAAVLECAFSCSSQGLGYRHHHVGVFLNVFEDHVDPKGAIATQRDLAIAKSFVFSRILDGGWAVFNADDPLVCEMLTKLPDSRHVNLLPCGLSFDHFNIREHLQNGGAAITAKGGKIMLLRGSEEKVLCDMRALPWTFSGEFMPSVWNLMHACGAVYGFYAGNLPHDFEQVIENTQLGSDTGRLVMMKARHDVTVLADYAHEKVSLAAVAGLAHTLATKGKVIGVVRLNHERSDDLIRETGHVIADSFDELVVYDKIDGYWRQPVASTLKLYPQVIGRTSEILATAIAERNPHVTRILREDEAIKRAAEIAKPGDVVVVIVNDDVQRSLGFIQEYFGTEPMA